MLVFYSILAIYIAVSLCLGFYMCLSFCFSKTFSLEETKNTGLENGEFTDDFFSNNLQDFSVKSRYGFTLRGFFIKGNINKTIVFVHGHTSSFYGMIKYMQSFIDNGWNIVAYNHRRHGNSDKGTITAGYREKFDLETILEWTKEQFPRNALLGIFGESLGGATVLQYTEIAEGIDFIIADCPFSDSRKLFYHQLSYKSIPRLFHPGAVLAGAFWMRLLANLNIYKASPIKAVMKQGIPVLLFHGDADTYVPAQMSIDIYEKRKEIFPTTLHLISGAEHAKAYMADPKAYTKLLWDWIHALKQTNTSP